MSTHYHAVPLRDAAADVALALRLNRPLAALVAAMIAVLTIALLGLVLDPRVITGAPAWLKPAKFAVSIIIYGATLAWLLTFLREQTRLVTVISWLAGAVLAVEMALIALQVVRGTTSHFNFATPFDATVFRVMAGAIVTLWLLTAVVAAMLARRRFAAPPLVWGVRLGLIGGLLGMAVAVLMTVPNPEQAAALAATGSSPVIGGHTVGAPDGGAGLPIVGWSTTHGDLRVAHFVGLHALQIAPLAGWLLLHFAPRWLPMRDRSLLTAIAGLGWIALTLLLTWQALRGQPVTAPDRLTLAALGALAIVTIGAMLTVVRVGYASAYRRRAAAT